MKSQASKLNGPNHREVFYLLLTFIAPLGTLAYMHVGIIFPWWLGHNQHILGLLPSCGQDMILQNLDIFFAISSTQLRDCRQDYFSQPWLTVTASPSNHEIPHRKIIYLITYSTWLHNLSFHIFLKLSMSSNSNDTLASLRTG